MPNQPTIKPKNLRRLNLQIEEKLPDRIEDVLPFLKKLQDTINDQHRRIEEAFADAAGHNGPVGFASDVDLQANVVKNSGRAKDKAALPNLAQVDQVTSFAVGAAVNQALGAIDITELPGADEVFDLDIPAQPEFLTLAWKKKAGWIARFGPPINVKRTLGYFVSFFNDSAGIVWMNPDDGTVAADQTEAERFVDVTHYTTNLLGADPVAPFDTTGVKARVVALVKIKGKGKVRGTPLDSPTLVPPGGDPGLNPTVFTGTGPPILPMGLERANTGGAGTNTTTVFHLDAGASSVANAYVGSGERMYVLYIPSAGLAHLNPCCLITAYDEINKAVTVTPAMAATLGLGFAYEIHRGLGLAGSSSTGNTTTTFKLDHSVDSRVSTTSGHYKGWMLYIPHLAAGQQLQRVTDSTYAAPIHTLTYEPTAQHIAPAAAPLDNSSYMLCEGAFGWENFNGTGRISPAPMRLWLDTDITGKVKNVVEPIPPVDFNLTNVEIQAHKLSDGRIKWSKRQLADDPVSFDAQNGYYPMATVRYRNLFRDSSDGWSDNSSYVNGYKAADTPTAVYEPSVYIPVEVDFRGIFPD